MKLNPGFWRPVAIGLSALNVAGAGFAAAQAEPWHATTHAVLALACWLWAQRLRHGARASEVDRLRAAVRAQAAALESAGLALADQSAQLAELEERLAFAERMLAQAREPRDPGPPGEHR
ncbi:MAG TPA: hypothetical protein VNJ71_06010 [Gemmatimonadales bacterium]|nr:hypothetical protein [Gemmatimonadales bacterium]